MRMVMRMVVRMVARIEPIPTHGRAILGLSKDQELDNNSYCFVVIF